MGCATFVVPLRKGTKGGYGLPLPLLRKEGSSRSDLTTAIAQVH